MSGTADTTLDNCGCCQTTTVETDDATAVTNPPGQPALHYRIDTQPTFFQRMLTALPRQAIPPSAAVDDPTARHPLTALTARSLDDPAIALLDAWAVVGDVLTFYQERIANEGFLRTATERRSVLELAREIGYELNPGVAASAELAFVVEDAVGAPDQATVPVGTRVLSVPGQGETPQTFETIEPLVARPEWNDFPPRRDDPEQVLPGMVDVFLAGVRNQIQVGDPILFVGDTRLISQGDPNWDVRIVTAVETDAAANRTRVAWNEGLNTHGPAHVFVFRKRARLFGHNAPEFRILPLETQATFVGSGSAHDWGDIPSVHFALDAGSPEVKDGILDIDINDPKILAGSWMALAPGNQSAAVFTQTLSVPAGTVSAFPPIGLLPAPFPLGIGEEPPPPNQTVTPVHGVEAGLFQVVPTFHPFVVTRAAFALSSPATRVKIDNHALLQNLDRRQTEFFLESEQLELASRPVIVPVDGLERIPEIPDSPDFTLPTGNFLAVGLSVAGLQPGQKLALVGKRPNVLVVDLNTLGVRTTAFLQENGKDISHLLPIITALQSLLFLQLDDQPNTFEPVEGHSFELLDPLQDAPELVLYGINFPLKTWHLRSRTGATGIAHLPAFAVDAIPADPKGETISEIRRISEVFQGRGRMLLKLDQNLQFIYDRGSLTISGNVASATHGETVSNETLGSGDPSASNQTFVLKKKPLTYVSSPDSPTGAASTLSVRVNNVLWRPVRALFGSATTDQVYMVRLTDDGQTNVIFGDGTQGSRLPSGTANVVATYRDGIGPDGQVGADTLSLLATRPLGIRSVINPLPATGAAAPAAIEDARQNAPLTVRTLDRVVSVADVQDFASSFAGIGKAQALLLWSGTTQVVHVTVAGADGKPIPQSSPVPKNLSDAIKANADPSLLIPTSQIASFNPRTFGVTLQVNVDARFDSAAVKDAVRSALLDAFSFANRQFGQPVNKGEILAVAQGVPGVVASNVASLTDDHGNPVEEVVVSVARFNSTSNVIIAGELLTIDPARVILLDLTV